MNFSKEELKEIFSSVVFMIVLLGAAYFCLLITSDPFYG